MVRSLRLYIPRMRDEEALRIMSALAQPTRFRIVSLLAQSGEAGMASGDIADEVGVPRNLMSSHLAILSKAGLVGFRKTGRAVVYVLRAARLDDLCEHLGPLRAAP